ncbi:N-acetyl-D-glucosamine kinase [Cedecea neteri]|uniref:N-acetyl-D-glucosamine kinase n=1 Tax=Cedecea neteri TaxID=158822 RepID=A0A2X3JH55_9ENTR|nr:N-acetyl-D-glucosamine kinase [Cedecea neteri]
MYYGFDIGGTKIALGVYDQQRRLLWEARVATPHDTYENFLGAVAGLVAQADEKFNCRGSVGIGIPGMPETDDGTLYAANVPAASGKPLRADLSAMLDRDVRIDNDANCFTLSEAWDDEFLNYPVVMGPDPRHRRRRRYHRQRQISHRPQLHHRRIRPYPPAGGRAGNSRARHSLHPLRLR